MNRSALLVALFTAACAAPLASAAAKVECKGDVTSQLVLDSDSVDASWRSAVTNMYGAPWADLGMAHNKRYYDTNLGLGRLYYMTAQPCRNVSIIINRVPANPKLKASP